MKKIIIIFILFFSFNLSAFATDACERIVLQEANFIGKASFASNIRNYPCVGKSKVLGVTKKGEELRVIGKVDGWYKIKSDNGTIFWIWDKSVIKIKDIYKNTNTKNNNIKIINKTTNKYILTYKDRKIINKVVYKINKFIDKKGEKYRRIIISRIDKIVLKNNKSDRIKFILLAVKEELIIINKKEKTNTEDETLNNKSSNIKNSDFYLKNIDVNKVKKTWLGWYNEVRKDLNLKPYYYKKELENTALEWSEISKNRGDISHKRNSGDSYYDYNKITSWFKDRGVVCKNVNRTTYSENIGWGKYSCNDGECSDELIVAIKRTFNMYLSEKGKAYNAHYKSIVQPYFKQMGLGIKLDEYKKGQFEFYLTVHFCTEVQK